MILPEYLQQWFRSKSWTIHPYQQTMFEHFKQKNSVLLVAPTGGGKTLASFLPALENISETHYQGLHTLYISPLKALTQDIHRNLLVPIKEMELPITVEIRTGDTSAYQRQKQIKKPPNILLTTPESLLLLLSYPQAPSFFNSLKLLVIDEVHSLIGTKRGDLLSLALAQVSFFAKNSIRFALSATIARPEKMAKWVDAQAALLIAHSKSVPNIHLLTNTKIPYSGFMAQYAIKTIYEKILTYRLTLIFVNTRAQTEFLFQQLWLNNSKNIPIAIYHGSLSKEERLKTESLIVNGTIKAVVATSALELGIDWGNVDAVIQIGAPHSVSRLLQRIGRSNHRFDEASTAYIVPTNCFEVLESEAAIRAISEGKLDDNASYPGALDVVVQFIINCACSQPVKQAALFHLIRKAHPYRSLKREVFQKLFQFTVDGGYVLHHYPQYHRLIVSDNNTYIPATSKVIRRHRQNIGTIIESARLKVKVLNKRRDKLVGDIEEQFIQELSPGDSFVFAGEVLEYIRIHDMVVETRIIKKKSAKLPSYRGGIMPLSSFLASAVLRLVNHPQQWKTMPQKIQEWLQLQKKFSYIPDSKTLLIEQFPYKKRNYLIIYSFEGRKANNSLGMLFTRHLEKERLKPLSFTATDYGLAICTHKTLDSFAISTLFSQQTVAHEYEEWLLESALLKRSFRHIAIITGLTERQTAGTRKSMKQVTFSTDLIYEVLRTHEPDHILLKITRMDVDKYLIDLKRVQYLVSHYTKKLKTVNLSRPSPFSIPIISTFATEKIQGEADEILLTQLEMEARAEKLIHAVGEVV